MNSDMFKEQPNLVILGARGIGMSHAKAASLAGANISAIMGKSMTSTEATAKQLAELFGFNPNCYTDIDELIKSERIDGAIIATPPHCHYEQLSILATQNIPVLCEKPLFDISKISYSDAIETTAKLQRQQTAPLFINTSNCYLFNELPINNHLNEIHALEFIFHTHGKHTDTGIAFDLLPHGISLISKLGIVGSPKQLKQCIGHDYYIAEFIIGHTCIRFDFRQGEHISKRLCLKIDEINQFERIQQGSGKQYRVFLSDASGKSIEKEDPFISIMRDFIRTLNGEKVSNECSQPFENMRGVIEFSKESSLITQ